MERPMSVAVVDEKTTTPTALERERRPARMERPMSIAVVDDDVAPNAAPMDVNAATAGKADHSMRLPKFDASCPHVRDHIIPMNGGRFNVDQYLRVLRAKAEVDQSIAMALTVAGQQGTAARAPHHFTVVG